MALSFVLAVTFYGPNAALAQDQPNVVSNGILAMALERLASQTRLVDADRFVNRPSAFRLEAEAMLPEIENGQIQAYAARCKHT